METQTALSDVDTETKAENTTISEANMENKSKILSPVQIKLSPTPDLIGSRTYSIEGIGRLGSTILQPEIRKNPEYWAGVLRELGYHDSNFLQASATTSTKIRGSHKHSSYEAASRLSRSDRSSRRLKMVKRTASQRRLSLVRKARRKGRSFEEEHEFDRDELVYQYFDVTMERLQQLFNHWDSDNDNTITAEEFIEGLRAQNVEVENLTVANLKHLLHRSSTEDLEVSFAEFSTFIHRTKLAILFDPALRRRVYHKIPGFGVFMHDNDGKEEYIPTAAFMAVDYSKSELELICGNPNSDDSPIPFTLHDENAIDFFFGSRDPRMTMRWLSVNRPDPVSIIAMAVKYRLHPLALEDILALETQRPKVDRFGTHYFIVMPSVRLTVQGAALHDEYSLENPEADSLWARSTCVEMQNVCICVAGPNAKSPQYSYDTLISIEGGYFPFSSRHGRVTRDDQVGADGDEFDSSRSQKAESLHRRSSHATLRSTSLRQASKSFARIQLRRMQTFQGGAHVSHDSMSGDLSDTSMFREKILGHLATDFSKHRMQRSVYLLHACLDACISELMPVIDLYHKRLDWYSFQIRRQRWRFGNHIRGLLDTKRELERLTEIIRPCTVVLRHLISDDVLMNRRDGPDANAGSLKQYFEDIDDHVSIILEELRHMAECCSSYHAEFGEYGDKRMNDILFVLTIVTTLFVPGQFLTGVFGMNFVKPDGTPNMPLLTWQYGYPFFWIVSLFLALATFAAMFAVGWMPCASCVRLSDRCRMACFGHNVNEHF